MNREDAVKVASERTHMFAEMAQAPGATAEERAHWQRLSHVAYLTMVRLSGGK